MLQNVRLKNRMTEYSKGYWLGVLVGNIGWILAVLLAALFSSGCAARQETASPKLTQVAKRYDWEKNHVLNLTIKYNSDTYEYSRTINKYKNRESCLTTVTSGSYTLSGIDSNCDNKDILFFINLERYKRLSLKQEVELISKIKYINQCKQVRDYVNRWKKGMSLFFKD